MWNWQITINKDKAYTKKKEKKIKELSRAEIRNQELFPIEEAIRTKRKSLEFSIYRPETTVERMIETHNKLKSSGGWKNSKIRNTGTLWKDETSHSKKLGKR